MRRNTSVSPGDYFEDFVENKIAEGRYKNAGEVIRAGLRLLEKESRVLALRSAIEEGINSGNCSELSSPRRFEHLKSRKKQHAKYFITNKAVEKVKVDAML